MVSLSLGGEMKKGRFTEEQMVGMLPDADRSAPSRYTASSA